MSSFGLRLRKVLRAHVTALIAGVIGGSTGSRCPPLLLLLYRRDDRRCISVVADGAARTARFHDHGLQSGGHVCSGSHSPCAGALSRPSQDEPTTDHADRSPAYQQIIEQLLNDPRLSHLYFDIPWDEVAKYVAQTREIEKRVVEVFNRYPDRFLFGTVGPA
jgi:hypothetical protein